MQKCLEKNNRWEKVYVDYANDRVIFFKDKERKIVEKITNLEGAKKILFLNLLLFLKWQ